MKKFLLRLSLFLLPLSIYIGAIILIDPFNYFYFLSVIPNKMKVETFYRDAQMSMLGTMLWKLSEYDRSRCDNIILGDSRAKEISSDTLKKLTNMDFYNFGTPGGDCGTYINLFWYCNARIRLKNVYIGVSFHNYGDSWRRDLFSEAILIRSKIYPFCSDKNLVRQAEQIAKLAWTRPELSCPITDKMGTQISRFRPSLKTPEKRSALNEKEWELKVQEQIRTFKRYKYPDDYLQGLKKISAYCAQHNIKLVFIILPNNSELYDLIASANLKGEMERFKNDIRSLGETYDFDYPNEITCNKEYYYDIQHFNWVGYDYIYREVWKHEQGIAIHTFPK